MLKILLILPLSIVIYLLAYFVVPVLNHSSPFFTNSVYAQGGEGGEGGEGEGEGGEGESEGPPADANEAPAERKNQLD